MGCNCNKNNGKNENNKQTEQPQFRKEEAVPQTGLKQKLTMMQSFAMAIASRGLTDQKIAKPVKQLRVLSCFGNQAQGGVLPPCEHLKKSSTEGKFYCGGCGCGDRKGTWLVGDDAEYSKLDYPKLNCPLQMPGFSNYEKSKPDEANPPITRRFYIDQLKINVSNPDPPGKPTEEQK
jgi:hypothetical protein